MLFLDWVTKFSMNRRYDSQMNSQATWSLCEVLMLWQFFFLAKTIHQIFLMLRIITVVKILAELIHKRRNFLTIRGSSWFGNSHSTLGPQPLCHMVHFKV